MTTVRRTEQTWWDKWVFDHSGDSYQMACGHAEQAYREERPVHYFYTGALAYCPRCADLRTAGLLADSKHHRCARCEQEIPEGETFTMRRKKLASGEYLSFELCELCELLLIKESA